MKVEMTFADWLTYKMPIDQVIINASPLDGSDRFVRHMIGVSLRCRRDILETMFGSLSTDKINIKLYCKAFAIHTDRKRRGDRTGTKNEMTRESINNTLEARGFVTTSSRANFFADLVASKFTFSPEGNGIDCHRHYEALIFKSIPIIENNPFIEEKYDGLPIIFTRDYKDIDQYILKENYENILGNTYNFSKLFIDWYDQPTQRWIKRNGNYWARLHPERSGFYETLPWPNIE